MADIIRLIPKSEFERARLIREARAIYDSIFPPDDAGGEQGDARPSQNTHPAKKNYVDPIETTKGRRGCAAKARA